MSSGAPLLELRNITKRFGATTALRNVSLSVRAGEIHGLVGQNGAGKSTLISVAGGFIRPEKGEIRIRDRAVQIRSPRRARDLGIAVVPQVIAVAEHLTVAENVALGALPSGRFGFVDHGRMRDNARRVLSELGLAIDPNALVEGLSVAERQLIEIARNMGHSVDVMILDEPTAALSDIESRRLYTVVRRLRDQGCAVLYVSHYLREVVDLSDRITVMRDGAVVVEVGAGDATEDSLVEAMVGSGLIGSGRGSVRVSTSEAPIVRVSKLAIGPKVHDFDLAIAAGEVVALVGQVGSGRVEVGQALAGLARIDAGELIINGHAGPFRSVRSALGHGVVYVPEDRQDEGLVLRRSVTENITLGALPTVSNRFGWINRRAEERLAEDMCRSVGLRGGSLDSAVRQLSGGNQQKVLIGRALATRAKFLIFNEPTRGVDVKAKEDIYKLVDDVRRQGAAVLVITTDAREALTIADRVVVMRAGAVTGEFSGVDVREEDLVAAAS